MATIVGALAMSHGPQLIMPAQQWPDLPNRSKGPFNPKAGIASEITVDAMLAKEARCKKALTALSEQLYRWKPDAVIVMGDDQHENVLDDNQPPFLIYIAKEADATLHFEYLGTKATDQMRHYMVDSSLARGLLDGLMESDFDPAWSSNTREETGLGHAFGRVLDFLMPGEKLPIVPVMVNTYFPPAPSARRCLQFGKALRKTLAALPSDARVVLVASGGMSHFIIDENFDAAFIKALESRDESYLSSIPASTLVAGTSELRNWIIAAGAMNKGARMVDYVPCYRNDKGIGCAMGFAVWEQ
jgi:aromatic ring-opening dioxygenase catalytic subunit (LigB family)